jgi:hypothetical protein
MAGARFALIGIACGALLAASLVPAAQAGPSGSKGPGCIEYVEKYGKPHSEGYSEVHWMVCDDTDDDCASGFYPWGWSVGKRPDYDKDGLVCTLFMYRSY